MRHVLVAGATLPRVAAAVITFALAAGCSAPVASSVDPAPESAVPGHTHHTIDYIELTVTDMAAAQRFYGEVFGWRFTDYGPDYAGIQSPEGPEREVGGFVLGEQVIRGGPLVVLFSEDLDATVAAVRAAGGDIVTEPFDFPGGRRFHFLDPSGNELAVWAAASGPEG